ncbi:MAG: ATP synthase F1 subunit delta [Nitrospirales bacterium]|nr:ATP synthase F1 subunit delta [Nitrospira sp.]MDR4500897.1 ATP synthase F1 subunit delta [Nitrospirales bacterium]
MNKSSVARRYASALFNLLEEQHVPVVRDSLNAIARALESSQSFKHAIASPVFTFEEKNAILKELCDRTGAPPVMKQFFTQLLKKNRGVILPEIAEAFSNLADEKKGVQHIWVASAKDLTHAEQQQLETELSQKLNRAVKLEVETVPTLIAGLQIRIGSLVFDNTIRGKLDNMRTRLAKG